MSSSAEKLGTSATFKWDSTYYVTDVTKLDYVEHWQMMSDLPPIALLGSLAISVAKIIGKDIRKGPPVLLSPPNFIELREVPDNVQQVLQPVVNELINFGFAPLLAQTVGRSRSSGGFGIIMLSNDSMSVATAGYICVVDPEITIAKTALTLSSRKRDETSIVTTDKAPGLRLPPAVKLVRLRRASPAKVIAQHQRRIADLHDIVPVMREEVRNLVEQSWRRAVEFQVARGYYTPATEEELAGHGLSTSADAQTDYSQDSS